MKPRTPLSHPLSLLADIQEGVISRQQLLDGGTSRRVVARLLAEGGLTPVVPGIYTRIPQLGWLGRAWTGLLLGGDRSALGCEAAAFLHGLTSAEPAEITVFTSRQLSAPTGWRLIRGTRRSEGEPARTGIEDTVLDLCSGLGEDGITALLADAVSSRKTSTKRLVAAVHARSRLPQRALLRDILGDVSAGAHSALERRFLIDVERAHGLPTAERQRRAHTRHRSDAWYRDYGVIAELDSTLHHRGANAFRDMSRDNDHALMGLFTMRLGWGHVVGTAACETAAVLGRILASRGWVDPLTPCSRCRLVHPV